MKNDLCVFNKVYKGEQVTVIFHVDDLLGACVLSEALEDLYEVLIKKYKKVKVTRGKIHPYLGMIMNFLRPGVVTVANPGYMSDLNMVNLSLCQHQLMRIYST